METITLERVLPAAFAEDAAAGDSEVWGRDVTFRKGEYVLVEAASGTGKTSLCGFLYGSRRDYTGRIRFDGADSRALRASEWAALRRGSLSLLFQDLRLFGELTVTENLALKNDLTGFLAPRQIDRLLEATGLAEKRDAPVARLSLGQQQRVAFLRCLCQPFDFILLDEPVSHLDPANGRTIASLLLEAAREQGAGILVTSVGSRLCVPYDRILTL